MTLPPNASDSDSGVLLENVERLEQENEALRQTLARLQQSNSRFLSVISHEVRIPLTSIKGYTDLLRQETAGEVTDQQRAFLDVIANNAERMRALITTLVDLTRLETGELPVRSELVRIDGLVRQVSAAAGSSIEERDLDISLALEPDLPAVRGDAEKIKQVLEILLDNAVRYSGDKGGIQISGYAEAGKLHIRITDSGFGVWAEDMGNVFEPFYRSEDPRVREKQGWGLGLSLAQALIEKMGGEIGLESVPDTGSTFWLALPAA